MMISAADFYAENVKKQVDFFHGEISSVVPYFLTILEIELANSCNLDCPFCYTSSLTRERGFLPYTHYTKLVDYLCAKELKPRISFSGDGEMFLHKKIVDFVRYAKERGFHVQIINNGTLCTPEKAKQLIDVGLDRIQFSIDSINKETYMISRAQKAKGKDKQFFEKALLNALEFSRLNYEAGSPVSVSIMSVQTEQNKKEAEDFKDYWHRFPVDNVFLCQLYTLAGTKTVYEEAKTLKFSGDIEKKPVCVSPFMLLCIKVDGTVLACTHDSDAVYPIGNIIENEEETALAKSGESIRRTIKIDELWNNERIQKLRQGLLSGKLDYFREIGHDCQSCNCPLTDGNIEEYKNGLNSAKVEKIWESMKKSIRKPDFSDEKYKNVCSEIARLTTALK